MPVFNLAKLDKGTCDEMNRGCVNLGPHGQNVISEGECRDLEEAFGVGLETVRRWFKMATVSRRIVPISQDPNDRTAPFAVGRRIATMYPTSGMPPRQANAINDLRYRCYIGACAGTEGGLERDPIFTGKTSVFTIKPPPVTLTSCMDICEGIIQGTEGEHGRFIRRAWYRIQFIKRVGGWDVKVWIKAPGLGDDSDELPPEDDWDEEDGDSE